MKAFAFCSDRTGAHDLESNWLLLSDELQDYMTIELLAMADFEAYCIFDGNGAVYNKLYYLFSIKNHPLLITNRGWL